MPLGPAPALPKRPFAQVAESLGGERQRGENGQPVASERSAAGVEPPMA